MPILAKKYVERKGCARRDACFDSFPMNTHGSKKHWIVPVGCVGPRGHKETVRATERKVSSYFMGKRSSRRAVLRCGTDHECNIPMSTANAAASTQVHFRKLILCNHRKV